jgi:UDP-glucose 4-epimerase
MLEPKSLDTLYRRIISQRSLITGGAGFIGSHLAEALLARGERVTVLDDESTGRRENLAAVEGHSRFRYVHGSAGDETLLAGLLAEADDVYHLAAAVGVKLIDDAPIESIERNLAPVEALLRKMHVLQGHGHAGKLFVASSSEVYGKNPHAPWREDADLVIGRTDRSRWSYGAAKAIDEFLALAYWRQYKLPVVIGRFFNVVGPRQRGEYGMVLPRFVESALAGRPLRVHDDGQQVRCFAHVNDVVGAVIGLMQCEAAVGQVYNIGSDEPITILDLAGKVIQAVDPALEVQFQPYAEAYSPDFEDVRVRVPDITKLRRAIGYSPQFDLEATIRAAIQWRRELEEGKMSKSE